MGQLEECGTISGLCCQLIELLIFRLSVQVTQYLSQLHANIIPVAHWERHTGQYLQWQRLPSPSPTALGKGANGAASFHVDTSIYDGSQSLHLFFVSFFVFLPLINIYVIDNLE